MVVRFLSVATASVILLLELSAASAAEFGLLTPMQSGHSCPCGDLWESYCAESLGSQSWHGRRPFGALGSKRCQCQSYRDSDGGCADSKGTSALDVEGSITNPPVAPLPDEVPVPPVPTNELPLNSDVLLDDADGAEVPTNVVPTNDTRSKSSSRRTPLRSVLVPKQPKLLTVKYAAPAAPPEPNERILVPKTGVLHRRGVKRWKSQLSKETPDSRGECQEI